MKQPPQMLTAPWLITEDGANLVWAVWSRGEMFRDHLEAARADRPGPYANTSGSLCIEDGVAVIQVTGPIFRKAGLMSELSGATTDEQLRASLGRAIADPSVRAIVLEFDSPGGEAAGAAETAAAIRAANEAKPVLGYIPSLAASKAYWFASACRELVIAPDALVGCIGARKGMVDDSEADKAMGVRFIDTVNDASPAKRSWPIDEEVLAEVKRELNDIAAVFIDDVAFGRGVTSEKVVTDFGRGGVLIGAKAVAAGMADRVGNRGDALERARTTGRSTATRGTMTMSGAGANAGNQVCNGCDKQLGGEDPIFCQGCKDSGEASAFRAQVLAALGADSEASALGKIAAGIEALASMAKVEEKMATERQAKLSSALTANLAAKRLTPGELTKTVPFLLGSAGATAARAALEALSEDERAKPPALVAAIVGAAPVSEESLEAVSGYLASKGAPLPTAFQEPTPNAKRDRPSSAGSLDREVARGLGLSEEAATKYSGVTSADHLHKRGTAAQED